MGRYSKRKSPRATVPVTTPSPYKGLNTVDALSAMDPAYALAATNFIASPQGLSVRTGFRKWATGLPTVTTSILPYHSGSATSSKNFAVSGSAIYDITNAGAVGAPVFTGLNASNPYWQQASQTYGTGGGHYLVAVNGADMPLIYDGTTWAAVTQVGSPSAVGQFKTTDNNGNAVNMASFVDILLHQQRLWFVRNNSTTAYYCDIGQAGGNLYAFDFAPLFPRGGKLFKLASWTIDTGSSQGTQVLLVAISDKGDTAIYMGNNPAVASSWALMAQYQLGSPVGRRCAIPYQGDLMILSQDGLYPLSKYLQSSRVDSTASLTYTIAPTISNLVSALATTPGFELNVYPGYNVMLLNVPQTVQANNFQFCYDTINKGWTQFSGWPAQCFGLFNDALYFGGPDYVALAFIGYKDGADINGNGGNNIIATGLSAYTAFTDTPGLGYGKQKHVKLIKPFIVTGAAVPLIRVGVNTDFNLTPIVGTATLAAVTGAVWDNAVWDSTSATWVGTSTTFNQWQTVLSYPGEFCAVSFSVSATADTLWTATGWIVEPGGQFG